MLYIRPPLVRKFAFQMVLAGIRYICCGQKRIAIHAYRQVLAQYLGRRWKYIEEHLHAVLGAQCVEVRTCVWPVKRVSRWASGWVVICFNPNQTRTRTRNHVGAVAAVYGPRSYECQSALTLYDGMRFRTSVHAPPRSMVTRTGRCGTTARCWTAGTGRRRSSSTMSASSSTCWQACGTSWPLHT